jgi:hypothetical protein
MFAHQNELNGELSGGDEVKRLDHQSAGEDVPPKKPFNKIKFNTFIIQKYIEKPLLINKRKFDIRVWVCLTHDQDVYFFPEGYLRTCGTDYGIDL